MSIDIGLYRVRVGLFAILQSMMKGTKSFNAFELLTWLSLILMLSGDIHRNPGPNSTSADLDSSSSSSSDTHSSDNTDLLHSFRSSLSFCHYNVQSFYPKRDILCAELAEFDVLSFTETWLGNDTASDNLTFQNYSTPFRKDRPSDNHGGILVYVKEHIPAIRRTDLEPQNLECLWVELRLKRKRVLLGTFYRPPNSSPLVLGNIETSIGLALDTNIKDIIITGDLNLDMLKQNTRLKVDSISQQYGLSQIIQEPTHYTESSRSLIDVFLVSSKESVCLSGVGDPFLEQNIRYHCPIFCCLNYDKPKCPAFKRNIWQYDRGNYAGLREDASTFSWDTLIHPDINTYATNITHTIIRITEDHIPHKTVTVRQSDPPWMHMK